MNMTDETITRSISMIMCFNENISEEKIQLRASHECHRYENMVHVTETQRERECNPNGYI